MPSWPGSGPPAGASPTRPRPAWRPPTAGLAPARARADGVLEIFEAARPAVRHLGAMRKVAKKYPESKDARQRAEKAAALCKSTAEAQAKSLAKVEAAVKPMG